ncbi:MAG: hypothetical protein OXC30_06665, partial [Alphaproteobacteria bacterium]|nr:hypothetical protein [Alphaproteobacteria bacterium]
SLQHEEANYMRSTEIAEQGWRNYTPKWRQMMDMKLVRQRKNIMALLGRIFPDGDAPDAI